MPRTVLGVTGGVKNIPVHERHTLYRQSSAQLPSEGVTHSNNQMINAMAALSPGATLQKAKRMYI